MLPVEMPTADATTDKGQMIIFIDEQFRRLGMFYGAESGVRNEFIRQLDYRTKYWVLNMLIISGRNITPGVIGKKLTQKKSAEKQPKRIALFHRNKHSVEDDRTIQEAYE
jgi:hypothetical protein